MIGRRRKNLPAQHPLRTGQDVASPNHTPAHPQNLVQNPTTLTYIKTKTKKHCPTHNTANVDWSKQIKTCWLWHILTGQAGHIFTYMCVYIYIYIYCSHVYIYIYSHIFTYIVIYSHWCGANDWSVGHLRFSPKLAGSAAVISAPFAPGMVLRESVRFKDFPRKTVASKPQRKNHTHKSQISLEIIPVVHAASLL